MSKKIINKGWSVTLAGIGINLALGILYTWSLFKASISKSIEAKEGLFNWSTSQLSDPYSVCCLVFAFAMILAGKCQDKYGPRVTTFIGGVLVSMGLLIISQTSNYYLWVLGFGVFAGAGIGFGYSAATPSSQMVSLNKDGFDCRIGCLWIWFSFSLYRSIVGIPA